MLRHRVGTVCLAVLALFAFPREGSAHFMDFIWEMSGPQMIGVVVGCEYDLQRKTTECRALDKKLGRPGTGSSERPKLWVALDSAAYFSTGKDSGSLEFDWFGTGMLAFEPLLTVRSYGDGGEGLSVHHGLIGLSYDFLFGKDFSRFDKVGLKFTPIGVTYKGVTASFNLRVYPNGFTPDEFGFGPRQHDLSRPSETVIGFSVGRRW